MTLPAANAGCCLQQASVCRVVQLPHGVCGLESAGAVYTHVTPAHHYCLIAAYAWHIHGPHNTSRLNKNVLAQQRSYLNHVTAFCVPATGANRHDTSNNKHEHRLTGPPSGYSQTQWHTQCRTVVTTGASHTTSCSLSRNAPVTIVDNAWSPTHRVYEHPLSAQLHNDTTIKT